MRSTLTTVLAATLSHQCCVLGQPPASMGVPFELVTRTHATTHPCRPASESSWEPAVAVTSQPSARDEPHEPLR